ncbi:MAG: oxidoreductase [Bacteroidetes bacterium]|jgi:NAD(P)H-flavin reductase|nr:oxidoreductase [Bacteroidota bacterium]
MVVSAQEGSVDYIPVPVPVLQVRDEAPGVKTFSLAAPQGEMIFKAGQFVQISVFGYGEAPFTVCSSPGQRDRFELCVAAVGRVSNALHRLAAADQVGVRGPFGNPFPLEAGRGKDLFFVAGGTGMACLRSVISYCRDHRSEYGRLIIASGVKTPEQRLFATDFQRWHDDGQTELHETVDEPDESWRGRVGVVPEIIDEIDFDPVKTMAFIVGPPVVFRFAARNFLENGVAEENIYFSIERRFQCGVGKCGHCQINDLYVCQDGPVFSYSRLKSRSEAVEATLPNNH